MFLMFISVVVCDSQSVDTSDKGLIKLVWLRALAIGYTKHDSATDNDGVYLCFCSYPIIIIIELSLV